MRSPWIAGGAVVLCGVALPGAAAAQASISSPASAPALTPAPAPGDDDAEWSWRDRMLSESDTLTGGTGLLHTQHAETGAPGQFRIALVGEWFSAGFLCTPKFPCPNPSGGPAITSDRLDHVGGTLSLGVSLFKTRGGAVDVYSSMATYANSDPANSPELLQVLGDTDVGIKYVASKGDYLDLGAFAELWLINGAGGVGLDGRATSGKLGLIGTLDLRGRPASPAHVPLRISVNASYMIDNTADAVASAESAAGEPITRIDRYGLGINRVDHFDFLAGAEAFLADERIRPFVEGHIEVASNRQGYTCDVTNPDGDHCLASDPLTPATITAGVRVFPWKRAFSLLAAADVGLTTHDFIEELQPVAPWTLYLGAGWAVDTRDRPARVERREAIAPPPRARVEGFVHERGKAEPLAGAVAEYRGRPDLSPLATAADGKFGDDLPPGAYAFDVRAEGYKPGSCEVRVPPGAGPSPIGVDCALDALPRTGAVAGHVRDADTGQPLPGSAVVVAFAGGAAEKGEREKGEREKGEREKGEREKGERERGEKMELRKTADASGAFRFEAVPPGTVSVRVEVDGYMVQIAPVEVEAHHDSAIDLMLRPLPKKPKVIVTAHELAIKEQIQFALDSAVILPDSYGILAEITDTLIRHPEIKLVEVQGHTDNTGSPDHNRALSEARAEAVRTWIVQHGVGADRLYSHGYGPDHPLVPNVSAKNRAANRRVQLIIESRGGEGKGKDASPAAAPPPRGEMGF